MTVLVKAKTVYQKKKRVSEEMGVSTWNRGAYIVRSRYQTAKSDDMTE
jgi:hypothetical protein